MQPRSPEVFSKSLLFGGPDVCSVDTGIIKNDVGFSGLFDLGHLDPISMRISIKII